MAIIDELLDEINKNRYGDVKKQNELCDALLKEAENSNDDNLKGQALFYKGETMFPASQSEATSLIQESLIYIQPDNNPVLSARANNLLGIALSNKEDYTGALSYLLECLKICERYEINYIHGLCCCNVAVIFQLIGSYDTAIEFFEHAIDSFKKEPESPRTLGPIATVYVNIFLCQYKSLNIDKIRDTLEHIREGYNFIRPIFSTNLYEAIYLDLTEPDNNNTKFLLDAVNESLQEENMFEYVDNYQLLCEVLFKHKMYDELSMVLDMVDRDVTKDVFPKIRMDFVKYRMSCLKNENNIEGYMEKAAEYVSLYEKTVEIYHDSIKEALRLKLYVEELKEKEDSYRQEAITDNLTKLYNRKGLLDWAENALAESKRDGNTIATAIIDIDFFKQFNDFYGHVKGDGCIKNVADVLSKKSNDNFIAARFGGDEFVMFGANIDGSTLEKTCKEIVEEVFALQIASEKSLINDYVTVTIGANLTVPKDGDSVETLIDQADKCLYKAKAAGKNRYVINLP